MHTAQRMYSKISKGLFWNYRNSQCTLHRGCKISKGLFWDYRHLQYTLHRGFKIISKGLFWDFRHLNAQDQHIYVGILFTKLGIVN